MSKRNFFISQSVYHAMTYFSIYFSINFFRILVCDIVSEFKDDAKWRYHLLIKNYNN